MAVDNDEAQLGQIKCACTADPLADLPSELRTAVKSTTGSLRQVICPGCGLKYWTNRSTDLCVDCQKKVSK